MILRRVFVAVLLLLLVDTAVWAMLCRRLEQGIGDAVALAPQTGWSLAAATSRWAGWPFAAAIDLSTVSAAASQVPGLVWQAQRTRVELALLHPETLSIRIGGAQSVQAPGVPTIPFTAERTVVDADLAGATPTRLTVESLAATLPTGPVTLAHADLTFPPNAVTAALAGLSLPGVTTPIAQLGLRATIDPSPAIPARAWQQAGGHIDIAEAALTWDTLQATGSGRITLDDRLQPQAAGTVQATGLPKLLDDLARAGTLAAAQAAAAKAVIAILAAPTGGERVQLPISLDDGVLRLAGFPLARLPPLRLD